jgi:hypothetical protein
MAVSAINNATAVGLVEVGNLYYMGVGIKFPVPGQDATVL